MKYYLIFILLLISTSNFVNAQEEIDSSSYQYEPGDHELFLMPTAYTMERGKAYFSNYELFFLNFSFGATSRTHIGTFFLFPITTTFTESFSIGAKQNYYKTEKFQAALWGSYTVKDQLYTIGNVFSIGEKSKSIHIGVALFGEAEHNNNYIFFLLGGRIELSKKIIGIIEYTNAKELLDEDFNGILSFGLRFRGESTAWELAAVRPLVSTGSVLFLPLLKATFYF